ncbi:uncharacterized protein bod1l1 isoform X2 [Scyliorhinus torazame]|uniref:uncharacterized protein bod1l1 isoform X2 n=1 Tax=Scyliorhinus torazame TaxID=75743 RepID=UPI003B59FB10
MTPLADGGVAALLGMAALEPGDPKLVSMIVNHLKNQGLFDQFRRDCLADVDTKPAYQNLRQRVDNFVSNHLASHTWSPHLNKNQLRNSLRQMVLQSGMLEVGVDRVISQVVDPKINHIFRPQVEKAVHEFLATLDRKEEPAAVSFVPNSEKSEPTTPGLSSSGPSTSKANDALSILDTITSLNQEASAARSTVENSYSKNGEKSSKKNLGLELKCQQSFDLGMEKDGITEEAEKHVLETKADDDKLYTKIEGSVNLLIPVKDFEENDEKTENAEECVEDINALKDVVLRKDEHSGLAKDERRGQGKEWESAKSVTAILTIKQKAKENLKKEYSLEDSDFEGLSDITVSSVHTSDLSSFDVDDDEEEGEVPESDSNEEEQKQSSEEKDTKLETNEEQKEGRVKPGRHPYIHKPFLYSKYYSDSDDEETVVQRRQSIAKEKAERLLRRQWNRERGAEKLKHTENEKERPAEETRRDEENLQTLGKGVTSNSDVEMDSRQMQQPAALIPKVNKATLKEQKVLEKKVALRRKRKGDLRNLSQELALHEDRKRKREQPEEFDEMQIKTENKEMVVAFFASKDSKNTVPTDLPSNPVQRLSESIQSNDESRNELKMDHEPCRKQLRSNSFSQELVMKALEVTALNDFEIEGNINSKELSKQEDEVKHIKESDEEVVMSKSGLRTDTFHIDADQKLRDPSEEKAMSNCLYVIAKSDNKTLVSSNSSDPSLIEQNQDVKSGENSKIKEEKCDEKGKEKIYDAESSLSKSRDNIQEDAKGHEKNKEKRNEAESTRPKFKENSQEDQKASEKGKEKLNDSENFRPKFKENTHEDAKGRERSKEMKNEVEHSRTKPKETEQDDKAKEKRNECDRSRSRFKESLQETLKGHEKGKERKGDSGSSWSKSKEKMQEDVKSHEKVKEIQNESESSRSKSRESLQEDVRSKEKRKCFENSRSRSKEELQEDKRNEKRIEKRHDSEIARSKSKEIGERSRSQSKEHGDSSRSKFKDSGESSRSQCKDLGDSSRLKFKDSGETSRSQCKDHGDSSRSKSKDSGESSRSQSKDSSESSRSKSKDSGESSRSQPTEGTESSRSKSKDNGESSRSQSKDGVERSRSKYKDSSESSRSKSKDGGESLRSKSKESGESSRSKSKDGGESSRSKSKDNGEILRSKSKDSGESSRSKSKDGGESSRPKSKDGGESSRSQSKDDGENSQSKSKGGESSRSKSKDSGESSRSKSKDSGESSRSKSKDSGESSRSKSKDSGESSRSKSKDGGESSRSQSKDRPESSQSKSKDSGENLCSKSKGAGESSRSQSKDGGERSRSQSKDVSESSRSKSKDIGESLQSKSRDSVESHRSKSKDSDESLRSKSKDSSESSRSKSKVSDESSRSKSRDSSESSRSKSKDSDESSRSKSKDSSESSRSKSKDSSESSRSKSKVSDESSRSKSKDSSESSRSKSKVSDESSRSKSRDSSESSRSKSKDSDESSRSKSKDSDESTRSKSKVSSERSRSKSKDSDESTQSKSKDGGENLRSKSKDSRESSRSKPKEANECNQKGMEKGHDSGNAGLKYKEFSENMQSQSSEKYQGELHCQSIQMRHESENTCSKSSDKVFQIVQNNEREMEETCDSENTASELKDHSESSQSIFKENMQDGVQDNAKGNEKSHDSKNIHFENSGLRSKGDLQEDKVDKKIEKMHDFENTLTISQEDFEPSRLKSTEQSESSRSKYKENLPGDIQMTENDRKCNSENIQCLKSREYSERSQSKSNEKDQENIQNSEIEEEKIKYFESIRSKSKEYLGNLQEESKEKGQSSEKGAEKKDNFEDIQSRSTETVQNNQDNEKPSDEEIDSQNSLSKTISVDYRDVQTSERSNLENAASNCGSAETARDNGTEKGNVPENGQPESEAHLQENIKTNETENEKKNDSENSESKLKEWPMEDIDKTNDSEKESESFHSKSKEEIQVDQTNAEKGIDMASSQIKSEESTLDSKEIAQDCTGNLNMETEKILKSEDKLEGRNETFESEGSEGRHVSNIPKGEKEHGAAQSKTGDCTVAVLDKEQTEESAHDQAARPNELNIPLNVEQRRSLLSTYEAISPDTPTLDDPGLQRPISSIAQFVHYDPSSPATPTLDENFSYEAHSVGQDTVEPSGEGSGKDEAQVSENIKEDLCNEQQAEEPDAKCDPSKVAMQELPVQQDVVSEIITSASCEWKDEAAEKQSVDSSEEQTSSRRERKPKRPYTPAENPSKRRHLHSEEIIAVEDKDMPKPIAKAEPVQVEDEERPTQSQDTITTNLEEKTRSRSQPPVTKQGRKREASPGERRRGQHKIEVPPKRTRR